MVEDRVKPQKYIRDYLPKEDIWKIIDATETERDELLLETLWFTGARISEIVGIEKWHAVDNRDHLDFGLIPNRVEVERNQLILYTIKRTTKGEEKGERIYNPEERAVGVPTNYLDKLVLYIDTKEIASDERIFPITSGRAYQIISESGKNAGIEPPEKYKKTKHGKRGYKNIRPHLFRHSFCVQYIRKTGNSMEDLRDLQRILNHRNLTTTAHYLMFGEKMSPKEMERIFGREK